MDDRLYCAIKGGNLTCLCGLSLTAMHVVAKLETCLAKTTQNAYIAVELVPILRLVRRPVAAGQRAFETRAY